MNKEITVIHECGPCKGTGLYVGMAERDGAAVVCASCKGKGFQESVFKEFTGIKERDGIRRVFEVNPGIIIGEDDVIALADYGGMSFAEWKAGRPFVIGMENRAYTCPRWWSQCTGARLDWPECYSSLGRSFTKCEHFCNKSECWKRYDAERTTK